MSHASRWLIAIGVIFLIGVTGWLWVTKDSFGRAEQKSDIEIHMGKASPTPVGGLSPGQADLGGALPPHPVIVKTAVDLAALSLKDLWAIYKQPATSDHQLRARVVKGISHRLGQSAVEAREVHAEIAERLRDEAGNERERVSLARVLGESDSPEALATLFEAALSTRNSNLFRAILEQLDRMGSPQTPQQVSAMADVAKASWGKIVQGEKSATALYPAIGKILAKLGEPGAVQFLRAEAVRGGLTIIEFDAAGSDFSVAAMNASFQVRGEANVPILYEALRKSDPSSTEFIWSGQALASLGRQEATAALIEWTTTAPDSCAQLAGAWLGSVRDSRSHALMRQLNATGKTLQFGSASVRDAVLTAASKFEPPR